MVQRWEFHDPYSGESYTVPINPNEMGSLFPEKNVSTRTTTAVDGQVLLFEGHAPPAQWEFGGVIFDWDHYAELQRWSEKRNRIQLTDHFGRTFWVYLLRFDPTPQRSRKHYWRHGYTMSALVLSKPSEPTVGV